jgi:hypothetical protein
VFLKLYEDIKKDKYIESLQCSLVKKKGNQRFPKDNEIYEELKIKDNLIKYLQRGGFEIPTELI